MKLIEGTLITVRTLADDFRRLGVADGMTVLVHSSFKSLGSWVAGGPPAVILALEEALGAEGTLMMPTHSTDLSDPAGWSRPPVPQEWWTAIREETPAYDKTLTLTRGMGILPETFRRQRGTRRSAHPLYSFAARGPAAERLTSAHPLPYGLGDDSPLARLYDSGGMVLLLGVGHENNTSLHLSEYRADWPGRQTETAGAPVREDDGARRWRQFPDLQWDSDDFALIGAAYESETGVLRRGRVAGAEAMLMPQRSLVDYGVEWIERNRAGE
ncbi:aminoglycoside N(3)-acetyltransferase [Paenibacillus glufosinatiresistens]|uniref:aminoglycoside N(3)-acetyltransferase n=1 Tax=Paenibacillus glufosinatiresistens TaxID=3070657 RepID=UPI00286DFBD6|nr:AAC(3) family N-acetyltransferase [Paenibacillus sp. YX.27]